MLNQLIAAWLSFSKVKIGFFIVFLAALIVPLPAKFNKFVFDIQKYQSLINMWSKIGLSIESWGIPVA